MRVHIFLIVVTLIYISGERKTNNLLTCCLKCNSSAKDCLVSYNNDACQMQKDKCITDCYSVCWNQCMPSWKACFKDNVYKHVATCVKKRKTECLKKCGKKNDRTS